MGTLKDITGQKFGRLTVIKRVPNQRVATTRWLCRCECGKIKEFDKNNLVNGHYTAELWMLFMRNYNPIINIESLTVDFLTQGYIIFGNQ